VIFGGVGAGLYGMLMYAILAVFIAGLMVGRTPEYLGKKIEQKEVKMAMLAMLVLAASILLFSAAAVRWPTFAKTLLESARRGAANLTKTGPHGLSRCSTPTPAPPATTAAPSAGSTPTRPGTTPPSGLAMLIGRFLMMIPLLAAAGSWRQEENGAGLGGHLPHARPAVCGPAGGRHGDDCRRADVFPGALAGPGRGALPDATAASCFPS
jgi:K+-transporting ATPase ATPase A chain